MQRSLPDSLLLILSFSLPFHNLGFLLFILPSRESLLFLAPLVLSSLTPGHGSCAGADPTAMLQRFAEKRGLALGEQLHMISLGQGQGPIAEMLMVQAAKAGHWVCLQNCHLASSWMLRMEEKVEELSRESSTGVHPDFRLWLTSMPSQVFPVLVLQNGERSVLRSHSHLKLDGTGLVVELVVSNGLESEGGFSHSLLATRNVFPPQRDDDILLDITPSLPSPAVKLTNEPPKGVKANVNRSYNDMTAEHLSSCEAKPLVWRKLLFSLSFFHAVVQVRASVEPSPWRCLPAPLSRSWGSRTCFKCGTHSSDHTSCTCGR